MENERRCSSCQQIKNLNEFYPKGNRVDKTCKDCRRIERRERYGKLPLRDSPTQVSLKNPEVLRTPKPAIPKTILTQEEIRSIAEAFILLESWSVDSDAEGEISNSKRIQTKTQK